MTTKGRIVGRRHADPDHDVISVETVGGHAYRRKPCGGCPRRVDQTGEFPAEAFAGTTGIRPSGPYAWVLRPDEGPVLERSNFGTVADVELAAHARTDVPLLLEEIARLRDEIRVLTHAEDAVLVLATTERDRLAATVARVRRLLGGDTFIDPARLRSALDGE